MYIYRSNAHASIIKYSLHGALSNTKMYIANSKKEEIKVFN